MKTKSLLAWCPDHPHRPTRLKRDGPGAVYRCPVCGSRHSEATIRAWHGLYREPETLGRPGFDPITGFESQDLPR